MCKVSGSFCAKSVLLLNTLYLLDFYGEEVG